MAYISRDYGTDVGARPTVSVVIPTLNRPNLVKRAVQSALGQTFHDLEVIVVIDGPDTGTISTLSEIEDQRFIILPLPMNVGPSEARMQGIAIARGTWIALLDDDDAFFPEKIAKQYAAATASEAELPIVVCGARVVMGGRNFIAPDYPLGSTHVSEYWLVRKRLFGRPGLLQASGFFVPKRLFDKEPMLYPHSSYSEDTGWIMRACSRKGTKLIYLFEPLYEFRVVYGGNTRSSEITWRENLRWADEHRLFMTKLAFTWCMLTKVARSARTAPNRWTAYREILSRVVRYGTFSPMALIGFVGVVLLPNEIILEVLRRSFGPDRTDNTPRK
jgi:glycosyltransferase involved in cell wall biosynthesis